MYVVLKLVNLVRIAKISTIKTEITKITTRLNSNSKVHIVIGIEFLSFHASN